MTKKLPFLKVHGTDIVDAGGRPVLLKGAALGGWLMMEGYMLGGRNIPEKVFKQAFEKALGKEALDEFTDSFRSAFIREEDIALIKEWGANCIRVPFNYRLVEFEERPFSLNERGLSYLDKVVKWCGDYGVYCILDMHAAPGAQNPDWHADCVDKPELFSDEFNKERYFRLWHFLAARYKDSSAVAGYDVLNEPVVKISQEGSLRDLYERVTKEIRDAGDNHIIFLEGNLWGQRLRCLGRPADKNTAFSAHAYVPLDFVLDFEKDLTYPGRIYNIKWDKHTLEMMARPYIALKEKLNIPFYIGEFGVHFRGGYFGELKWVDDILNIFEKHKISWTYWTYKSVVNSVHPDGVFRYVKNPCWVNHKGPVTGWETYSSIWKKEKGKIEFSWRTENFKRNDELYSILKKHF